jgi:hypothetical protein
MRKTRTMLLTLFIAANLAAQERNSAAQASSPVSPAIQQQLDDLKTRMDAEHQSIQQLQQLLLDREQSFQQLQQEMNGLRGNAADSTPANAQASYSQPAMAIAKADTFDPEQPAAIHFRGITLTPGGFFDATGIYRTHNENADVDSTFAGILSPGRPTPASASSVDRAAPPDFHCWQKALSTIGRLPVTPRSTLRARLQPLTNWRAIASTHAHASCGDNCSSITGSRSPVARPGAC